MKLLLLLLLTAGTAFGADGDMFLSTAEGSTYIKARDAKILQSHWRWLEDRYNEAAAVVPGYTYHQLIRHFQVDGGGHAGRSSFRFVNNLAPHLKLDVVFEGELNLGKPDPGLKIKTVSQPYLDRIFAD